MLHTVYINIITKSYLHGLCGGVANFDADSDFFRFEENVVKAFPGGFTDLKYGKKT